MRRLLLPALAWLALGVPAWGQTDIRFPCRIVDYQNSADELTRRFGEARRGSGLTANDMLIEVWHNDKTGSWTILLRHPNGLACMIASGQAWQDWSPPDDGEAM